MKRTIRMIWLPVLGIVISLACSAVFPATPTATPPPIPTTPTLLQPTSVPLPTLDGTIAYSSDRDGKWQIVAMNADGSDETGLTAAFGTYSRPAWSPDGQKIAMRMDIETGSGIAVMDVHRENGKLAGAPPVAIVNGFADGPRWSPDGSKLVYVMSENSGGWITYIANTSDPSRGQVPNIPVNATDPDWSPDGRQIVFANYVDPSDQLRDLYVINTDGTGVIQLTNTPGINEDEPIWSPDGQKIVFAAVEKTESGLVNKDIFIMNRDGTNVVRITTDPGGDFDPSWSPDGKKIVFVSDRHENNDGNYEVYVIDADGTGEMRLTNNHSTDRWPTWRARQPDDVVQADCQPAITLVGDVTIPNGTRFATPQPFTKVWRVQNSGTCTWTPTGYTLRFVDGEHMGASAQIRLPGAIQPGATVDLPLPQTASQMPGKHIAHWQLFDRNGEAVSGTDGSPVMLSVDIEVLSPGQAVLPQPLYFLSEQSGSAQIWRMDEDARTVTQVTNEYQPVASFDVSQTGKLAYLSQKQVIISDPDGQNRQVVASLAPDAWILNLAWSADGRYLAYASYGIHVYDLSTGEDRLLIPDTDTHDINVRHYGPLAWSPDGNKLMAATYLWESGEISIITTNDVTVLAHLPQETTIWNRDSQSVYIVSDSYPEWSGIEPGLWRGPVNGQPPQPLVQQASFWWPVQRPDGTLAYFMHQPTGPETRDFAALLYISSADGNNRIPVRTRPILINANDTFNGVWADNGQSILVQLVRPALDVSEVLLFSADESPPLFLTPEMKGFQWGK